MSGKILGDRQSIFSKVWAQLDTELIFLLDDAACAGWVLRKLGIEPICRRCGEPLRAKAKAKFMAGCRGKCWKCNYGARPLRDTFLNGIHANYREIVLLFICFGLGLTDPQIGRLLRRHSSSVRDWRRRFEGCQ